jgi:hypothetical protein
MPAGLPMKTVDVDVRAAVALARLRDLPKRSAGPKRTESIVR